MITDIYYVIPEIFLSLSLMFLLLLGVFKKEGSTIVYNLSLVFLIIIGLSRILPLIGVWEIHQLNLLSKPGKFMKAHGIRVAKPD